MWQTIYWHAPLWQIVIVLCFGCGVLGWLLWRAIRRPDLSAAWRQIDPKLDSQPLFYISRVQGVMVLSRGAEQVLADLSVAQRDYLLNVLVDTASEAATEGRLVQYEHWVTPEQSLVATPLSGANGQAEGALVFVTKESREASPEVALEVTNLPDQTANWMQMGTALQVHQTRPIVKVRRLHQGVDASSGTAWREHVLSHLEDGLLRYLIAHMGEVQSAETLFGAMWSSVCAPIFPFTMGHRWMHPPCKPALNGCKE